MNNKPKVIDLFAGAGGFGLGFQLAGYNVICSIEIDEWASETLRVNNPEMQVIQDDIRNYSSQDKIRQVCNNTPHIIIGGPPCQGFSNVGPSQKKTKDPRNSLFKNFAFWVECLRPQVFIMENVRGILSRRNSEGEKVIDIIHRTFDKEYKVETWKINAAKYGVPQIRERVFIVGNRIGINEIKRPQETHYLPDQDISSSMSKAISVWEAISDLPKIEAGEGEDEQPYTDKPGNEFQSWARQGQKILYNHVAMKHTKRLVDRFSHIEYGQSCLNVPNEHATRKRNGNGQISEAPYKNNRRLHPDKPSYTIPASFYSSFIHPYRHRNLTAREAARIQSFPDVYRFMGKRTVVSSKLLQKLDHPEYDNLSQYNQIGNAVPPLLAKAIAEHIKKFLII